MIRIEWFEDRGPWLAGMTDREDGDFHYRSGMEHIAREGLRRAGVPTDRLIRVCQVHGTGVWCLPEGSLWEGDPPAGGSEMRFGESEDSDDTRPRADAMACAEIGWTLGISVADCLPVWVGDPEVPCVALIHAGRRGSLAGIAGKAVQVLSARYGADPRRMVAAIGPGAGPCCYAIGSDMAAALRAAGHPVTDGKLDLPEVVRRSLVASGLSSHRVHVSGICTICSGRFFSYRRGDQFARNLAVTALL